MESPSPPSSDTAEPLCEHDLSVCLRVLQRIADAHGTIPRSQRLNSLISKLYRDGRRYELRAQRDREEAEDRARQAATAMVRIQRDAIPPALALTGPDADTPSATLLNQPETCYVCKKPYREVHFFYHLLCPDCAARSYAMRDLHADLAGRTALVTGGRVKIGHQTVLRLLRDGARVLVTTRFPHAAARRLHAEPDSADWLDRVQVYGLDLRHIPSVEAFAQHLVDTEPALDIVIHNAAQTVRRPRGFYDELVKLEQCPADSLAPGARRLVAQDAPSTLLVDDSRALLRAALPDVGDGPQGDLLPADAFADNEERVDTRRTNSWLLRLDEVSAPEMLEVQLVNSVAPFLLNSRLKPLMVRSPHARRFIVNVSAMEGQFARHKTVYHPHTNMAKAALNMMTRTSADDYAKDRIYMNSVDTGWVTDENPTVKRERLQEDLHFFPPLDIVDGMARIYHPIAFGINNPEEPLYGLFLKDFAPCPW